MIRYHLLSNDFRTYLSYDKDEKEYNAVMERIDELLRVVDTIQQQLNLSQVSRRGLRVMFTIKSYVSKTENI